MSERFRFGVDPVDAIEIEEPVGAKFVIGVDEYQSVKVIGRTIGAARRGFRRPRDGDGDGFYSPFPGAPDKTPVPTIPGVDAVEKLIGLRQKVEKKYKRPKTQTQAYKILLKVFPTLEPFLEDDHDLEPAEIDAVYGLLVAAEVFPPEWRYDVMGVSLTGMDRNVGLNHPEILGSAHLGTASVVGVIGASGIRMALPREHQRVDFPSAKVNGREHAVHDRIARIALEAGYSQEQANSLARMTIAIHESAHSLHYHKMKDHQGISDLNRTDEEIVEKLLEDPRLEGLSLDNFDEIWDAVALGFSAGREIMEGLWSDQYSEEARKAQVGSKSIDEVFFPPEALKSRADKMFFVKHFLAGPLVKRMRQGEWDDLTAKQKRDSLKVMSAVSLYANSKDAEAVAEAVAAWVLGLEKFDGQLPPMLNWLLNSGPND